MIVYRICKNKFGSDLSGKGAAISGGRWNSKGVAVLYTSESRALCLIELAIHLNFGNLPSGFQIISIKIPDSVKVQKINIEKLPKDWREYPQPESTRQVGNDFIKRNRYLVLKVPSVIIPDEFNYLINPNHPDIKKIKVINKTPFSFDKRLFSK